jgi:hypothetical protein
MSDVEQRIQERVEAFVNELSGLVRQAALEAVSSALGGAGGGGRRGRRGAAAAPRGRLRAKGQKRTPAELERLVGSVKSYVAKTPGQGVEKMARDLGVPSKELVLPIKKLIASRDIKTRGHKRATKYFPGGGRARAKG